MSYIAIKKMFRIRQYVKVIVCQKRQQITCYVNIFTAPKN